MPPRRALEFRAGAVAQLAEAREPEPAGEAHHRGCADAGALRERLGGVECQFVEVVAQEAQDQLVVARQAAARVRDADVELLLQ
jgi:hypothetical protein